MLVFIGIKEVSGVKYSSRDNKLQDVNAAIKLTPFELSSEQTPLLFYV